MKQATSCRTRENSKFDGARSRSCDSRWLRIGCLMMVGCAMLRLSENGAIAGDRERRAAIGALPRGELASGEPGAALEHTRQRELRLAHAEPRPDRHRDAVELRHGQRTPFDDQRRTGMLLDLCLVGIAQREHAAVEEQPAIAIYGKAGELLDSRDIETRDLERLDDRVAAPLRQL